MKSTLRLNSTCSRCRRNARDGQRYCRSCHAEHMREWRSTHPLEGEARMKNNARAYAHVYLKRGKIEKKPCAKCGSEKAEMHHEDYSRPTDVVFLCRDCHLKHHADQHKKHQRPRKPQ